MDEIMNLFKQISKNVQELDEIYPTLSTNLSNIDKEISDIYHYIEFENLDAYRGFLAYRELRDCLRKRRVIKDQIEILDTIKRHQITKGNMNNIWSKLKNLETKKYTPRVRKELFDE